MTQAEWEVLYELLGCVTQIAQTSGVYSKHLADRLSELGKKMETMELEDEK